MLFIAPFSGSVSSIYKTFPMKISYLLKNNKSDKPTQKYRNAFGYVPARKTNRFSKQLPFISKWLLFRINGITARKLYHQ